MAIKAGRVGVRKDQVDPYGRLVATEWIIDQIKEHLNASFRTETEGEEDGTESG